MFYTKKIGAGQGISLTKPPLSLAAIVFGFARNRCTNNFSVLSPGMVGTPGPNLQSRTKYIETQQKFKNFTISTPSP